MHPLPPAQESTDKIQYPSAQGFESLTFDAVAERSAEIEHGMEGPITLDVNHLNNVRDEVAVK